MKKSITSLLCGVLLFVVIGGATGAVAVAGTSGKTPIPEEKPLPELQRRSSKAVPGEYLVLFRTRTGVVALEGRDRTVAVATMLDMQAEYLTVKFGVEVVNAFSAISESSGKGLFFVRSEKAAVDPEFDKKLLEEMRLDHFIEGVSPNEVQKMISVPSSGISKP